MNKFIRVTSLSHKIGTRGSRARIASLFHSRYLTTSTTDDEQKKDTIKKKESVSKQPPLPTVEKILQDAYFKPAGPMHDGVSVIKGNPNDETTLITPEDSQYFIPQVETVYDERKKKKRVLVLATGGTLTMAPSPEKRGALAPVQGAVTNYMKEMKELNDENMPEIVVHEYTPFLDSSDMGPNEWAVLASDVRSNYYHFDAFVILCGTDTMSYAATALSFLLENLNKPVVFTGSQIPLSEPYNDARRNLIMALIFATRDSIPEVSIFFHDRLLRACRGELIEELL